MLDNSVIISLENSIEKRMEYTTYNKKEVEKKKVWETWIFFLLFPSAWLHFFPPFIHVFCRHVATQKEINKISKEEINGWMVENDRMEDGRRKFHCSFRKRFAFFYKLTRFGAKPFWIQTLVDANWLSPVIGRSLSVQNDEIKTANVMNFLWLFVTFEIF